MRHLLYRLSRSASHPVMHSLFPSHRLIRRPSAGCCGSLRGQLVSERKVCPASEPPHNATEPKKEIVEVGMKDRMCMVHDGGRKSAGRG
jgi:hypothetical protein